MIDATSRVDRPSPNSHISIYEDQVKSKPLCWTLEQTYTVSLRQPFWLHLCNFTLSSPTIACELSRTNQHSSILSTVVQLATRSLVLQHTHTDMLEELVSGVLILDRSKAILRTSYSWVTGEMVCAILILQTPSKAAVFWFNLC